MTRRLTIVCLAALLFTTACLQDSDAGPALKVDLQTVVRTGTVQPVDGLSAAGQPDEAALEVFAEQGYTMVIDFRTKGEKRGFDEAAVIDRLGMEYVRFPIGGKKAINFENAGKLQELIAQSSGPVLIHCASSNRVGALLALRESLNGADDAAALEYGKQGGLTRLRSRVKKVLSEK